MPSLFDPIRLGAIDAPNRIFMAPLTRGRSTREHVPTKLMATYYAQRAGAGLIISEATGISSEGLGWPYAPGLWTREQVEGWKPVVAAVHDAGGRILAQLWHMGRTVHSSFLGGAKPVSASATIAPHKAHTYGGRQFYDEARPLALNEIPHALFGAAAAVLDRIGIAFLELREPGFGGTFGKAEVDPVHPTIRAAFSGPLLLNSDYGFASGQAALDAGLADAIAFGRTFLANPDLPARFERGLPLNPDVQATWYSQGAEGYTDYPVAA